MEHIYPQTPSGERWENHAALVNRLGNLTLLSRRLNVAIKNGDFATKKASAYIHSDIVMTKELLAREAWDPAGIDERQAELSRWVSGIWAFPGEAATPTGGTSAIGSDDIAADDLPDVPPE